MESKSYLNSRSTNNYLLAYCLYFVHGTQCLIVQIFSHIKGGGGGGSWIVALLLVRGLGQGLDDVLAPATVGELAPTLPSPKPPEP